MKILSIVVSLLFFTIANLLAQSSHEEDSLRFVTGYTITKQQIKTISFEGTIDRKKALSAVLGKTRYFKMYAVRNPYNNGYNFDWHISEFKNPIENQSFFFKEDDFFEVQERSRQINVFENIGKVDGNKEVEKLRSYLIPDELLYGLLDLDRAVPGTFEDDEEHFKMYNQVSKDLLRIVCYNKENLFPENVDIIQSYPNMTALDITSIRLTNVIINEELPEDVLSMEHYLNNGYRVNLMQPANVIKTSPNINDVEEFVEVDEVVELDDAEMEVADEIDDANVDEVADVIFDDEIEIRDEIIEIQKTIVTNSSSTNELDQNDVSFLLATKLQTGKGWETTIGKFHDKPYLLLGFWFASSPPSMQDLPAVQSIHRDFRKKGLTVFGVNCQDFEQKKSVVKSLKQKGITFTSLFGNYGDLKSWGIENIPTYVLLDAEGQIVMQGSSEVLREIRGYLDDVE